ncbi:MAG: sigma factor [Ardenticatenia bacterium]|nr:sigma factor [Ardenticatenia bacterium]
MAARNDVLDDGHLMCRIAAGDRVAFQDVYERYVDLVYSMALKVVRDPTVAEDIVQDVSLRLWQRADM